MKFSARSIAPVVLSFSVAFVAAGPTARADLGSVWVENLSEDSITVGWSEPSGIHRLYREAFHYRVCWEAVNPYRNTYPAASSQCEYLFLRSEQPFTIFGLAPGTYYRIKVEAFSEKRDTYGAWSEPMYRQVSTIRQKTMGDPSGHNLRLVGTDRDSIAVSFVNAPKEYDKIRFAYKQKWSTVRLAEVAGDALGPCEVWSASDGQRGWSDRYPAPAIGVTFSDLVPDQAYEIVVFGHKIGVTEGVRLGSVSAETAGFRPRSLPEAVLASDHQDVLEAYTRRISMAHGGSSLFNVLSADFPSLVEDEEFTLADEGDDLTNDLTLMLFLISARWGTFEDWQSREPQGSSIGLMQYVAEEVPHLTNLLMADVDSPEIPFTRGDADASQQIDISDSAVLFEFLFLGGTRIDCLDAADSNDDGRLDIADPIHLLEFLFLAGNEPPDPFWSCGTDPTEDSLGCEEFHSCAR